MIVNIGSICSWISFQSMKYSQAWASSKRPIRPVAVKIYTDDDDDEFFNIPKGRSPKHYIV